MDEVIVGAPYTVTKDVLEKVYKVNVLAYGRSPILPDVDGGDPYALPKSLGICKLVETDFADISTEMVIDRIIQNRAVYEARNRRKLEKALLEEKLLEQQKQKQQD